MRVENHPILGPTDRTEIVTIYVNDRPIEARKGESVAAAMLANGMRLCRHTPKKHEPRGVFCGIGQCTDCVMQVNGVPNVRTCVTLVEENMRAQTQEGVGIWEAEHGSI